MYTIPCMQFRGGTSKGPCFIREDLPTDPKLRDKALLGLMGSPNKRQIDGIGGGDSLTSKVVIVGKSTRSAVDVDYLLCQVHIEDDTVETNLNCGNMLSAVAPFAIEKGLVAAVDPETVVRIYNENTGVIMESTVQTPDGKITYEGTTAIDGVPGTGAPIKLTFLNAVGSKTKRLLPTGNVIDNIDGITVSCVDVAVPMVITYATALGKTGYETKEQLDNDADFLAKLEALRRKAAQKMGLGDITNSINPKICMISAAREDGTITSRYFTPFDCHDAHAVSGGLCLAAACIIPGTVANKLSHLQLPVESAFNTDVVIEHPSGKIVSNLSVEVSGEQLNFPKASFIRTARPLFKGKVFVPGEAPEYLNRAKDTVSLFSAK